MLGNRDHKVHKNIYFFLNHAAQRYRQPVSNIDVPSERSFSHFPKVLRHKGATFSLPATENCSMPLTALTEAGNFWNYLEVSWNRGNPPIIHFNGILTYKSSIWGYPHFRKPPFHPQISFFTLHFFQRSNSSCNETQKSSHFLAECLERNLGARLIHSS